MMNKENVLEKKYKESQDVIFMIEVLEYIWNPVQCFRNIYLLLKPGGICYFSAHFTYPVHNPVEQDYLRYTPRGCQKLLEETGFKIEDIEPRLITQDITRIDGMRPAKKYDKHNWSGCLIKCRKF